MNTKIGTQVRVNGEWGTITEVHEGQLTGMIDVRLPGGDVVVPRSEVEERYSEVHWADGFGVWHCRITDRAEMEPRSSDWAQMIRLARRRIAAELAVRAPRGTTFDDMFDLVTVARVETDEPHVYEFVEKGAGRNRP